MKGLHIYKASAGSGKTYTLSLYYLSLLLNNPRPDGYREILAMTFTNKAANEMKVRILSFLHTLAEGPEEEKTSLLKNLKALVDLHEDQVGERAKLILSHVLHNYSDFSILTLDKFIQRVIRAFSKELEFPYDFNIEANEEYVFQQVIDELLEHIDDHKLLGKVVHGFSLYRAESQLSHKLDSSLLATAKHLVKEKSESKIRGIKSHNLDDFRGAIAELKKEQKENLQIVRENYRTFISLLKENGLDISHFSQAFKKMERMALIAAGVSAPSATLTDKQLESIESGQLYPKKTPDWAQEKINDQLESFAGLILDSHDRLSRQGLYKSLIAGLYNTAVIVQIEKILSEFKRRHNLLFFIDFNRLSTEIIRNEPVPFIYERAGTRYKHLMLDEFQDTSETQFHNLLPLLVEALSKGGFGLIVGDEKQAIYRWRNGNVEQFMDLPSISLPPGVDTVQMNLERYMTKNETLGVNYRSKKTIVDFSNRFFDQYKAYLSDHHQSIFAGLDQKAYSQEEGYITAISSSSSDLSEDEFHLEHIKSRIDDLLERGYSLSDITILVRSHMIGNKVADHLVLRHNVPVVSEDSLRIDKDPTVQFILNCLRHFINPDEDVHRMAILKSYTQAVGKDYNELVRNYTSTEEKRISIRISEFLSSIGVRRSARPKLSMVRYILELVRSLELPEHTIHLQFFLNKILTFENRGTVSISEFLDWWDATRATHNVVIQEDSDAVRIMTLHKSKGLEFTVVIMPFINWQVKVQDDGWVDEPVPQINTAVVSNTSSLMNTPYEDVHQQELDHVNLDNANLLYVGFTRAIDELHLICGRGIGRTVYDEAARILDLEEPFFTWGTPLEKTKTQSDKHMSILDYMPSREEQVAFSVESPDNWSTSDLENQQHYGDLFHRIIAQAKQDEAVESLVDRHLLGQNQEVRSTLIKDLNNVIHHEDIAEFFTDQWQSYAEAEFLNPNNDSGIVRPDRVVMNGSRTCVLEFKTGEPRPEHDEQIQHYGKALGELGQKNVELYLIYTDQSLVKRIDSNA